MDRELPPILNLLLELRDSLDAAGFDRLSIEWGPWWAEYWYLA